MKTTIYGVYFICCKGDYQKIIKEQLETIHHSGLLSRTSELLCFICNFDMKVMKCFEPYKTFKIKFITTKENLYEKFALQNFRSYISCKQDYYLYYFHTKGVTHSPREKYHHNVRKNLDYFILEKYRLCLYWLERGYDVVGVALSLYPTLHFSGNFWWSKSKHLDKLPTQIRRTYYAPEMYVCSQPNGKYISICQMTNQKSNEQLRKISDYDILLQSTSVPLQNKESTFTKY